MVLYNVKVLTKAWHSNVVLVSLTLFKNPLDKSEKGN